jgi:hypothetical protein
MRVLRDHGPGSRDFMCAMLTLHTWMDANGFAYPSLRTWAMGSRMAVNTLRKHLEAAVSGEWLGVDVRQSTGQAWKRNTYRCAVPSHIQLNEKDDMLSDILIAKFGNIGEGVSLMVDTTLGKTSEAASPIADTPSVQPPAAPPPELLRSPSRGEGVSNDPAKVYQNTPQGVSNGSGRRVIQADTEVLKSEVPKSEVLKSEGVALPRNTRAPLGEIPKETEEARRQKARILMRASPDIPIANVAQMYQLTEAEVGRLRASV